MKQNQKYLPALLRLVIFFALLAFIFQCSNSGSLGSSARVSCPDAAPDTDGCGRGRYHDSGACKDHAASWTKGRRFQYTDSMSRTFGRTILLAASDSVFVLHDLSGPDLFTSTNPVGPNATWTRRSTGSTSSFAGLYYVNNRFFANNGQGHGEPTSANGTTWSVPPGNSSGTAANKILYTNRHYFLLQRQTLRYGTSIDNTNGMSSVRIHSMNFFPGNQTTVSTIAYGRGTFVMSTRLQPAHGHPARIALFTTTRMIPSDLRSNWEDKTTGIGANNTERRAIQLSHIAYGDCVFVGVSQINSRIYTSDDKGSTWQSRTYPSVGIPRGMFYATDGVFVVWGSNGRIITSADQGATWTLRQTGLGADISDMTYGRGLFIAGEIHGRDTSNQRFGFYATAR